MSIRCLAQQLFCSISVLVLIMVPARGLKAESLNAPNWDRDLALDLARVTPVETQVGRALAFLDSGRHDAALLALQEMSRRPDWMEPAQDRAVFEFARALSSYPEQTVPAGVVDFLTTYKPQTMVAHEEAIGIGVPLFPVASTAAGVRNQWRMEAASAEASRLIRSDPASLLTLYAATNDLPTRNGIRAAVSSAATEDLNGLVQDGLKLLKDTPELTGLLGEAALTLRDPDAYSAVVAAGSGAEMVGVLRRAPQIFTQAELSNIMMNSVDHAAVETKAVMLAEFSRKATSRPSGRKAHHQIEGTGEIVSWTQEDGVLGLGYPVPIPVDTSIPFDGFRTYNGLHTRHQQLMNDTDIIHGSVVGTTHSGNEVWAYRIGDEDLSTWEGMPEPATLTNGGIHAREWQTPEVVTGIMELFAERQGDNHFYDFLLENVNMVVIPVQNVDGFTQTQRYPADNYLGTNPDDVPNDPFPSPRDGRMRRKNMSGVDTILQTQDDHLLGIDLNRNNPPLWATNPDRSSDSPLSLVYHGGGPHSEPEAQALLGAAALGPADQLRLFNDVHSFSQVFYFYRTPDIDLNSHVVSLMFNMSNFNAALPNGSLYLFNADPNLGIGDGFGMTNEYFSDQYQIPAFGIEVEPTQGQSAFPNNPPGCGADYGGLARNCHDGFILPESQIRRVREELSQSISANFYQQAGPPSIAAVRVVDAATQAVVYEAEWDTVGATERQLYSNQVQAIELGRNYQFWLAYDRPMRWRSDGTVVPFPGQPGSTLNLSGEVLVGNTQLSRTLSNERWNNIPGDAPNGYYRYQDDTFAADVTFLDSGVNPNAVNPTAIANLQIATTNMTGQALDSNPATPITWFNGGWAGWENDNGSDSNTGGTDANYNIEFTSETQADPFVVEPGTSAAWFDVTHDGEGFVIEILADNRAVMYWFTYDENGDQAWYIAVGEVRGNRLIFQELLQTSGGIFGPDFDPSTVETKVVGTATFLYESCDRGTMVYHLPGRKGRFDLRRLSNILGLECGSNIEGVPDEATRSGSWFNIAQDGHGFTIELLDNGQVLVYWFTYDLEGKQAWFFGVGDIEGDELVISETFVTSGPVFGPDFNPDDLQLSDWGTLRFQLGCDSGSVEYDGTAAGFPADTLALNRLSELDGLGCEAEASR